MSFTKLPIAIESEVAPPRKRKPHVRKYQGTGGRSGYTPEIANEIFERMISGEPLSQICRSNHLPALSTVYQWLNGHKACTDPDFADNYRLARQQQANTLAMQVLEITDELEQDIEQKQDEAAKELAALGASLDEIKIAVSEVRRTKLEVGKMKIDARKWAAARMNPNSWGDRSLVSIETPTPIRINLSALTDEQLERLDQLQREAEAKSA